jgi:bifunctional non-homologous end joining protein LigD
MGDLTVTVRRRLLRLGNLDKVLYPRTGFTKGQVLDYYRRAAPWLLPHVRGRPLTLKRYPEGVEADYFYEKRCPPHAPPWLERSTVHHSGGEKPIAYCTAADLASLMWVANAASIELHALLALGVAPERPTVATFDLDPGPPADLKHCARLALMLRDVLRDLGLESFAKVSGKNGLHLYVPLNTPVSFEDTKDFARKVALRFEAHYPDLAVSRMKKELRSGKVFIDWSQNDNHKTTVCPYSLRATPEPRVSAPVSWDEVRDAAQGRAVLAFDPPRTLERLSRDGDLFAPVLTLRQRLPGVHPPAAAAPAVWNGNHPPPQARSLVPYRRKRRFDRTPEPPGGAAGKAGMGFVVQKHAARNLHYDFRLEIAGVLASWALPKGPSYDPTVKRLAVRTEDHPIEYASFEGVIPRGQYGGGGVIVWDRGTFSLDGPQGLTPAEALAKGHLDLWLSGAKLQGGWTLVRTADKDNKQQWLLMKRRDEAADAAVDPVTTEPQSVLCGLWVEDLLEAAGEARREVAPKRRRR